jgi:CelD/BcsL family acetyltransferase involved in cellulose biosynthesis
MVELASFGALRDAIAQAGLGEEAQASDIFCTLAWFENLAAHGLDAHTSPMLLLAHDASSHCAICLPLMATPTGLSSLSNYYSSLYGPVVWGLQSSAEADTRLWQAITQHLRQHATRWPTIVLSPLDDQATCYQGLQQALRHTGYQVDTYFCFGNWYLRLEGRRFATYAQKLPSPLRHSIDRGQRRLTRQGQWNIHIQNQGDDRLEAAIDAFVQVYRQSWKAPEPHPQFIPQLVRTAAEQGWLRLGVLTLDGQAIAAQLWLVKDGKASIYKLAYVEGFERFSAGSVLTHALMQHVIDVDHVQEVDYLTGDDAYKQDWMSHRRERRGIVAFDLRTLRGLVLAAKHGMGKWLKCRASQ